jgi:hypothetical protein
MVVPVLQQQEHMLWCKQGHAFWSWIVWRLCRLLQANYVPSGKFGDTEAEYLFAPYSTFTVISPAPSTSNNYFNPHVITLAAAIDNTLEDLDLPLAPWRWFSIESWCWWRPGH